MRVKSTEVDYGMSPSMQYAQETPPKVGRVGRVDSLQKLRIPYLDAMTIANVPGFLQ